MHRRALRDDGAADLDVGGRAAAGEELDGRLQPQDFLDGLGNQFGPLAQQSSDSGLRSSVSTQCAMVLTVES